MGEKEYDPQMHTTEHLVNGTIHQMLGCGRAFSTHIEKRKSKCDFRFDRNLTDAERQEIEQRVNNQIAAHLAVRDEMLDVTEAAQRYNLSRLPEGVDRVRIVHIGSYDSCPCIGYHVENTRELSPITLISSDWNEGVLRVRFKFNKEA